MYQNTQAQLGLAQQTLNRLHLAFFRIIYLSFAVAFVILRHIHIMEAKSSSLMGAFFSTRCLPIAFTLNNVGQNVPFLNAKFCFYQIVANLPPKTTEIVIFLKTLKKIWVFFGKIGGFFRKITLNYSNALILASIL